MVEGAGFTDFEITWRAPVFDGAPQSSSAAAFGTMGINYRALKTGSIGLDSRCVERSRSGSRLSRRAPSE